jgi:hypothetical protein
VAAGRRGPRGVIGGRTRGDGRSACREAGRHWAGRGRSRGVGGGSTVAQLAAESPVVSLATAAGDGGEAPQSPHHCPHLPPLPAAAPSPRRELFFSLKWQRELAAAVPFARAARGKCLAPRRMLRGAEWMRGADRHSRAARRAHLLGRQAPARNRWLGRKCCKRGDFD